MNRPGVVIDRRYTHHLTGSMHPESPRRIEVLMEMLQKEPPDSWKSVPPRMATEEELAFAHSESHIMHIASTAQKEFTYLDGDTPACSESFTTAKLAAGGLLAALEEIMSGALETAFAMVRPPGHHAEEDRAMGFCLFNNIAIAARYLQRIHGMERILIVDWDLHHGNGTQHIFEEDPTVLYFSTHQYPYYPGTGHYTEVGGGPGKGYTVNVPLPAGMGNQQYETVFREVLVPIASSYEPHMILVSAGFDIYCNDPLGGMDVTKEGFIRLVDILQEVARQVKGCKLFLALEGGYNLEGLQDCVQGILAFLGGRIALPSTPPTPPSRKSVDVSPFVERVISVQREFWPCIG